MQKVVCTDTDITTHRYNFRLGQCRSPAAIILDVFTIPDPLSSQGLPFHDFTNTVTRALLVEVKGIHDK